MVKNTVDYIIMAMVGISEASEADGERDNSQPDLDVEMNVLESGRMEEVL